MGVQPGNTHASRGAIGQGGAGSAAARIEGPQPGATSELGRLTMTELLERTKVPGVGVAVIKDWSIDFAKGYGLADVAANRPVNQDTLFQAASISSSSVHAAYSLALVFDRRSSSAGGPAIAPVPPTTAA